MVNDMSEATSRPIEENSGRVNLSASVTFEALVSEAGVSIDRAAKIRVEDSPNLKYIRLSGEKFYLPQKLIVTFPDGVEEEITADVPPGEPLDF